MQRALHLMILLLLLGLVLYWSLSAPVSPRTEVAETSADASAAATGAAVEAQQAVHGKVSTTGGADDPTGERRRRAYLLSLDQGMLTLLDAQDIEGDFGKRRGRQEEWTGMLRCQLKSKAGEVLAEDLLPAPDYVCKVLDPRSPAQQPVTFTPEGPVVFQVRLPRLQQAARLDIYRIIQPGVLAPEPLLGSIPLSSP